MSFENLNRRRVDWRDLKHFLTFCFSSVLSHSQFSVVIPKEIDELKMLEVLDLRDNKLIRNIPSEAETMQSLKHLDILCFLMANELDFVQMFSRFNRELLTYLDPQFLPRT